MTWLRRRRSWAAHLRREVVALYLAVRDRRCPWHARLLAAVVIAYALSPIDLIPDFIPVLGYADDALIVALALRSVTRHAGPDAVQRHWPGTPDGLRVIQRLAGISQPADERHTWPEGS